jgi:hypothetical protein
MTIDKIQKVKVLERGLSQVMVNLDEAMQDATPRWHVEDILEQQIQAGKTYGTIAVFLSHRLDDHEVDERFANISQHIATLTERTQEIVNVSQCLLKPAAIDILEEQVTLNMKFADNMDHLYKVYIVADAHFDELIKTYSEYTGGNLTVRSLMKHKVNKFAEDFALIMDLLIKASLATEDIDHFTPHGASVIVTKHKTEWTEFVERQLKGNDLAATNEY